VSEPPPPESLAPAPSHSRWGLRAAQVYLALVAVTLGFTVREMLTGVSGTGTWGISVLTAPWSVLLSFLARSLAPHAPAGAMRALGLLLVAASAALNARILYGIAARAERDVRGGRDPGGSSDG
jgi:hypothetical protein